MTNITTKPMKMLSTIQKIYEIIPYIITARTHRTSLFRIQNYSRIIQKFYTIPKQRETRHSITIFLFILHLNTDAI